MNAGLLIVATGLPLFWLRGTLRHRWVQMGILLTLTVGVIWAFIASVSTPDAFARATLTAVALFGAFYTIISFSVAGVPSRKNDTPQVTAKPILWSEVRKSVLLTLVMFACAVVFLTMIYPLATDQRIVLAGYLWVLITVPYGLTFSILKWLGRRPSQTLLTHESMQKALFVAQTISFGILSTVIQTPPLLRDPWIGLGMMYPINRTVK